MKRLATSLLLLSLSLTTALRADTSSQWMWHGAFPWVYSHAESSWWYMKAGTDGKFYAWKQGDDEWYFFDEVSKQWVLLTGDDNGDGGTAPGDESEGSDTSGGGQATNTTWDKRFGGSGNDYCKAVIPTPDDGYLLAGHSDSGANGDKSEANRGAKDYWSVKIDPNGSKVWDKRFGGSGDDECNGGVATSDGGYLFAGHSESGAYGDKSEASRGGKDYWSVKVDANGSKVWDKRFGGSGDDECRSVIATSEGGWLLAGYSDSGKNGDRSEGTRGNYDMWAVKIDANGNKIWDKRFGGSENDYCKAVIPTLDGGYLLAGASQSPADGDKSEGTRGGYDMWVVKIAANGNKIWDKRFGGSDWDWCRSVVATSDDGYLLGGSSWSGADGDKSQGNLTGYDYWAVKIDANGNKVWDKRFGGDGSSKNLGYEESCNSVVETTDGGYLLAGQTTAVMGGDKTGDGHGSFDYWVVKVDANGNKVWDKGFGGSDWDWCNRVIVTSDGGYLLVGDSASGADGVKSEASRGDYDMWAVKIDADGLGKNFARGAIPDDWDTVQTPGKVFELRVPSDFKGGPIQGFDSLLGEYESPSMLLTYDYGWYSNPLTDQSGYSSKTVLIDGKTANIVIFEGGVGVHFPKVEGMNRLTVHVSLKKKEAKATALQLLQTIRFP